MRSRKIIFSLVFAVILIGLTGYFSYRNNVKASVVALNPVALSGNQSNSYTQDINLTTTTDKTAELSTGIVNNYITAKSQSSTLTKEQAQAVGVNAVDSVLNQNTTPEVFQIKKLETFSDSDKVKLRNFVKNFTDIQNKYEDIYASDSIPQLDAVYIQSVQGQEQLKRISKLYSSLALELENIPVPSSQESVYVSLIQVYLNYSKNLLLLSNVSKDPTNAMVGLMKQLDIWDEDLAILESLGRYLGQQGVLQ